MGNASGRFGEACSIHAWPLRGSLGGLGRLGETWDCLVMRGEAWGMLGECFGEAWGGLGTTVGWDKEPTGIIRALTGPNKGYG